jgi:hypothetical protein
VVLCHHQRLSNPNRVFLPSWLSLEHQGSSAGCSLHRIHLRFNARALLIPLPDVLGKLDQALLLYKGNHTPTKPGAGLAGTDGAKPVDNAQIRLSTS